MKQNIVAAWPGTGKSHLCEQEEHIAEVECWEYRSGNFPDNYVQAILKASNNFRLLLISSDLVPLCKLGELGFKIPLIYPDITLKKEYLARYRNRKSPEDFIQVFDRYWAPWILGIENSPEYLLKTKLDSGMFLSDVYLEILGDSECELLRILDH